MEQFIKVVINSLVVFFLLIILSRIIGRKLLSQMSFFDFVIGITIGTIGATFVTVETRGFWVLLSPVVLTLAVITSGYLSLKSIPLRKLLEGEPVIVIQNGKIFERNLKRLRYNTDDLMMQLRVKNIFDLSEVEFAVLEPHGQLSVLKKSQNQPITPQDLGLSTQYKGLSSEIIRDGKVVEQNLKQNNLSYEWLFKELQSQNIRHFEEVLLATLSTDGKLYVDLRSDNPSYVQRIEDDTPSIG